MKKNKNFLINVHQLLGRCNCKCKWKAKYKMDKCIIYGMTKEMLDVISGIINDSVSCADYSSKKLILGRGALAHLELTKLGYEYDAHVSLDAEGVLMVGIPNHNIRQQIIVT